MSSSIRIRITKILDSAVLSGIGQSQERVREDRFQLFLHRESQTLKLEREATSSRDLILSCETISFIYKQRLGRAGGGRLLLIKISKRGNKGSQSR